MVQKWENAAAFREWVLGELDARDWRPVDLARKMQPDNPASMASSISKWLRGIRQPDPKSCLELAFILGADPDYVLELAGHRDPVSGALARDERRASIAAMIATMPPDEIDRLELIVRALHDEAVKRDAAALAAAPKPPTRMR